VWKDAESRAGVHQELLFAFVILQKNHAAAESVQFPAAWPFPVHRQPGLHFLLALSP
jgi:hypothetical protein